VSSYLNAGEGKPCTGQRRPTILLAAIDFFIPLTSLSFALGGIPVRGSKISITNSHAPGFLAFSRSCGFWNFSCPSARRFFLYAGNGYSKSSFVPSSLRKKVSRACTYREEKGRKCLSHLYNGGGLDCASHNNVIISPNAFVTSPNFDLGGKRGGLPPTGSTKHRLVLDQSTLVILIVIKYECRFVL
jgi:hypothetical protein